MDAVFVPQRELSVIATEGSTENNITSKVKSLSINVTINRGYSVCTMEVSDSLLEEMIRGDQIRVELDTTDVHFLGFIYSTDRVDDNLYRVTCRSESAKLYEPFSSKGGIDDATSLEELASLYSADGSYVYLFNTAPVNFGGSYERTGTKGAALESLCHISGAEFYPFSDLLIIEPDKPVKQGLGPFSDKTVALQDVFDYVAYESTIYNDNVGYVTIQDNGSEGDVVEIAKNHIYCEIDECSGAMDVYTIPFGEIDKALGATVSIDRVKKSRAETYTLTSELYITLSAVPESVSTVTVNGAEVTGWSFEQNILKFSSEISGSVTVIYDAFCYTGKADVSNTPMGRFIAFKMFYLDQFLAFQAFLHCDSEPGNHHGVQSGENMTCITPSEMFYPRGFDVWTMGGSPEFTFYNGPTKLNISVQTEAKDYISVERGTMAKDGQNRWIYETRYHIKTGLAAKSAGADINYSIDGDMFVFDNYAPSLEVTYSADAQKTLVKFDDIPGAAITMTIRDTTSDDICEYSLEGVNHDDIDRIPCVLPQTVPIDVAGQTGLPVADIAGKTIPVQSPSGDITSKNINQQGRIYIDATENGDYVMNITNITAGTPRNDVRSMVLKVNVNTGD